jgi:UPF0716 protein FxsA
MAWLAFFIVVFPILDLALMGHLMGFWNTVLLVLGKAVVGFLLIRYQGLVALNAARNTLSLRQLPPSEITTPIFLVLAGVLLIHPGILTDLLGLLCLVPGARRLAAKWAKARFSTPGKQSFHRKSEILEGEFEEFSEPMTKDEPRHISPTSKDKI